MQLAQAFRKRTSRGFSLIEMMVVIVIVSIVMGAILAQVQQTQQRATAEQSKLDQFQDAQNFVDQIATDIREAGFPNLHNLDVKTTPGVSASCGSLAWSTFLAGDCRVAAGLVSLSPTQIIFEGDVDGSGSVSIISYAVNGDGKCSTCLERAQISKPSTLGASASNAAYVAAIEALLTTGNYTTEIQNVQNTGSIFTAYDDTGTALASTSFDMGTDAISTAKTRVIQITLDVSDPGKLDPKTHQALEANITSRAQIVNCSMAGSATILGVSQVGGGIQLLCQP